MRFQYYEYSLPIIIIRQYRRLDVRRLVSKILLPAGTRRISKNDYANPVRFFLMNNNYLYCVHYGFGPICIHYNQHNVRYSLSQKGN